MSSRSSRKGKNSRVDLSSGWSEWEWDGHNYRWQKYRLDKHGELFVPSYSLRELVDVPQGQYEFEYKTPDPAESSTTPGFEESSGADTPRYIASPDTSQEDSSHAGFSTSSDYTYESATAALGNLDLNKGKGRETGDSITVQRRSICCS
jgi:hypothetical protein